MKNLVMSTNPGQSGRSEISQRLTVCNFRSQRIWIE